MIYVVKVSYDKLPDIKRAAEFLSLDRDGITVTVLGATYDKEIGGIAELEIETSDPANLFYLGGCTEMIGINSRLDMAQEAITRKALRFIDETVEERMRDITKISLN